MNLNEIVEAVLKVSHAFLPERIVYMVGAGGSVLLLLFLTLARLSQSYDNAVAVAIFGSGGLFASTAYGVLRAFDKTLDTITKLMTGMLPPTAGNIDNRD